MKHLIIAAALAIATPAFAVDLSVQLLDQDDRPVMSCHDAERPEPPPGQKPEPCKDLRPLTVAETVALAVWRGSPDERDPRSGIFNISPEEAVRRSELARAIYKNKDVALSAEDKAMIKKLIAKMYPIITVEQVIKVIDPDSLKK